MENRRQNRISALLKETFSEILMREGSNYYEAKTLVSVVNVKITPDLSIARFYLSIFNADDAETIIDILNHHSSELRGMLGKKLRHSLRVIPKIEFYKDESIEYADKMNKLFKDLNKEDKEPK